LREIRASGSFEAKLVASDVPESANSTMLAEELDSRKNSAMTAFSTLRVNTNVDQYTFHATKFVESADQGEPGPSQLPELDSTNSISTISQDLARTREMASVVKPFRNAPLYLPEPHSEEKIQLEPNLRLSQNYPTWVLATITTITVLCTLLYAWGALIPIIRGFLWGDPQKTIFTINLSSYITALFLDSLIGAACDNMRWALCCNGQVGASMLDFLALAGSTTTFGLVRLLFSRKVKLVADEDLGWTYWQRTSFRFWSAQRYVTTGGR